MNLFCKIFFVFFSSFSFSQQINNPDIKRTNHWYFGEKAGMDFSSGFPVAVTDGQMNVAGNPVTMSDTAGNLLFYSNRYNVWNRNHQIMPNGTDLIKWGTNSFSHSLCVPQPGNDNLYYMFYWEYDSTGFDMNLEYAIIDMGLDGGLGDVVSKRNFLMNKPLEVGATTIHTNGSDIWITIMKFGTDSFCSFLITNNGIDTTPIISNVGKDMDVVSNYAFSPDGSKLAISYSAFAFADGNGFQIFDFDRSTGVVSNPIDLLWNLGSYGVAFSPDGTKVYFSGYKSLGSPKTANALYQITITGDSSSTINSKILIDTLVANDTVNFNGNLGLIFGIQLAANGKIYTTRNSLPILGAIDKPNENGLNCNYMDSIIDLQSRNATSGFPQYMSSYFYDSSLVTISKISDNGENFITYPNPSTGKFKIQSSKPEIQKLEIFNLQGEKVFQISNYRYQIIEINLHGYPDGIYFLKIQHNTQSYSQKLIITN